MFNFFAKDKKKLIEKNENKDFRLDEKPKFKDLAKIVFLQQLIMIPIVVIAFIILMLVAKLLIMFWS